MGRRRGRTASVEVAKRDQPVPSGPPARVRGMLLVVAIVSFALLWAVVVTLSMRPSLALLGAAVVLGVPAFTTFTSLVRRRETPLDTLRLYVAEVLDLCLELLTFPFVFIVIPLQAASAILLFIGCGMILGVAACVVQNLFHLRLGLVKDWHEVGMLALFTVGCFAVSIPGMLLAQAAEESSVSSYQWLRARAEGLHERVQARLR